MMLEQAPKPPQFPDGLVVRSGDDGSAAEEQPPHVLGNGDSGCCGLPGYSFIFFGGKSERPPPMNLVVAFRFSICFPAFLRA